MATVTRYLQGSGSAMAVGETAIQKYQALVNVADLYTDGYTASDTFKIFNIPANTLIFALDVQIQTTLANVTSVSIGNTASGTEYVSAETDTAVGPFTDYENDMPSVLDETGAAGYKPRRATSAEGVYLTLGALGATSSGTISLTLIATSLTALSSAKSHTYTNV